MAVTRIPIPDSAKISQVDVRLDFSLAETALTVRTVNCLEEQGIFTVRELLNCTRKRLLEIPNFGVKTLDEVYKALATLGYHPRAMDPQQGSRRAPPPQRILPARRERAATTIGSGTSWRRFPKQ